MRQYRTRDEVWALDKEIEHALVKVPVILFDRFLRLIRRGVEHHDIHRPQLLSRLGHQAIHFCFVRYIGADHCSFRACLFVLGKRLRGAFLVIEIIHGHLRTCASQRFGHHLAQSSGASCYQRHLAFQ